MRAVNCMMARVQREGVSNGAAQLSNPVTRMTQNSVVQPVWLPLKISLRVRYGDSCVETGHASSCADGQSTAVMVRTINVVACDQIGMDNPLRL